MAKTKSRQDQAANVIDLGRTGIVARITAAFSGAVDGWKTPWQEPTATALIAPEQADSFLGPQQPVRPIAPSDVAGRRYDFPLGYNTTIMPRAYEQVSFDQLQGLSDNCEIIRLAIETRKDQLERMKWNIVPRDDDTKAEKFATQIKTVEAFFRRPDGQHDWGTWLRLIIDQLLVHDAPCLRPKMSRGGDLLALDVIDGATIKVIIDEWGGIPESPSPAYQQVLKGIPAVNFTSDELIYRPRNPRVQKAYGYSPVEQVIRTANISIRRQLGQLDYYTEGSVPDAIMTLPVDWNIDQIEQFQVYWDALLAGNMAERRKVRFVAGDTKYIPTKAEALKDEYDEWIARIVCFAFSLPPTSFIKTQNRSTSETMQEVALEEGLSPLMLWTKSTIDFIIEHYLNLPDLVFQWLEDKPQSALEQAQVNQIYINLGVKAVDEVRNELGLDPIGLDNYITTTAGPLLVTDLIDGTPPGYLQPPEPPPSEEPKLDENGKPIPPKLDENGKPIPPDDKPPGGTPPAKPTGKPDDKEPTKDESAKFEKAKLVQPINRDRHEVAKRRNRLERLAGSVLTAVKKDVIKQLPALIGAKTNSTAGKAGRRDHDGTGSVPSLKKLKKADTPEEVIKKIDLDGFAVLQDPADDLLREVAEAGGTAALDQIGFGDDKKLVDKTNQRAIDYAKKRAADLVTDIEDSTRDMLRGLVTEAMTDNWTNQELADKIEAMGAFAPSRALTIARTEIAAADVNGNMAAYRASGVVSGKYWIKGSEHGEEDECDDNADDGVIDIDDNFSSGDDAPPAHPNCVCDVIPVVQDDASEDVPDA